VRDIANTGCFLPHPSLSRCEQPFVLLVLCVVRSRIFLYFIFLYFYIFRYANYRSTMYRASDVFAEVQRYFYGNYVYGSKIAVSFPRNGKCIRGLDGSYVINVSRQG
jgi:hypothetical protein